MSIGKWIDRRRQLTFPPYNVRPSDILVAGTTALRDIGLELDGKIIPMPGHTVDSISVVLDDRDALVGDAAANMLQWAGARYRVIALDDDDEYYRSWRKLISAGSKRDFPAMAHHLPSSDGRKIFSRCIAMTRGADWICVDV